MNKFDNSSWPVLIVSNALNTQTAVGDWLKLIIDNVENVQHCSVIRSYSWEDAFELVSAREDLGTIIIDVDLEPMGKTQTQKALIDYCEEHEVADNTAALSLSYYIRTRNKNIPIVLMDERDSIEQIPDSLLALINGVIYKLNSNSPQYHGGKIKRLVTEYFDSVMPPFFGAVVKYVNGYSTSWHTPGHMGGQGFLRSPAGTAFHKFYGEDVLRADLSVSVPELGALLEHTGVAGEAERNSAKAFGANQTFYVLSGNTIANEIVWKSKISPRQHTLMDRNCHKSLACSMIMTDADPTYMVPMRNPLGIMGPVDFDDPAVFGVEGGDYEMSALTNSTYDGVCYNMEYAMAKLVNVKSMHFDEAWFAYAKFHPMYKGHFGMEIPASEKTIYATQSTHKLLTAFSQAAMIHIKLPKETGESPELSEKFHKRFNETYIMYGSTSPQYSIIASLDVATKMMQDNGEIAWNDTIVESINLRKKIASSHTAAIGRGDWFFNIWQPKSVVKEKTVDLAKNQEHWFINPGDEWHGFKKIKKGQAMLDPIKLTIMCPGLNIQGQYAESGGIPARIVTTYLRLHGIVCEKSDFYTFLILNSLGTTKGKQGTVVAQLLKFKEAYDSGALLEDVFPELTNAHPDHYENHTLRYHCEEMHQKLRELGMVELLDQPFIHLPEQIMRPTEAYNHMVKDTVELTEIDKINLTEKRAVACMLIPHPPGIPIVIGGEGLTDQGEGKNHVLNYLIAEQTFENCFPGYESDIIGVERTAPDEDGNRQFAIFLVKQ